MFNSEQIILKLRQWASRLFGLSDGVFYINGPETLPPPLTKEQEEQAFAMLMTDDPKGREKLIVHNLRLVVYIAKKFESTGICVDDLVSIGTIGLIKAVNTFSPEKNIKLATYASRCIENEILMFLRKSSQHRNDISIDEPLNIDWDGNELLLSDILGTDEDTVNSSIEDDAEKAVPLALALKKGGLPAAEVTFRTDAAEEAIRRIKVEVPDVCVCAGTVLNVKTAERAVKAGASAIISPGTNPEVVRWCIAHRVPVIPGCATPTEVEACMRMGLDFVKLFPAEVVGGVKMLKALGGPYGNMKFMPTGGISAQNAAEYLALPNVLCCGGSWMVPSDALKSGDFARIRTLTAQAAACL